MKAFYNFPGAFIPLAHRQVIDFEPRAFAAARYAAAVGSAILSRGKKIRPRVFRSARISCCGMRSVRRTKRLIQQRVMPPLHPDAPLSRGYRVVQASAFQYVGARVRRPIRRGVRRVSPGSFCPKATSFNIPGSSCRVGRRWCCLHPRVPPKFTLSSPSPSPPVLVFLFFLASFLLAPAKVKL